MLIACSDKVTFWRFVPKDSSNLFAKQKPYISTGVNGLLFIFLNSALKTNISSSSVNSVNDFAAHSLIYSLNSSMGLPVEIHGAIAHVEPDNAVRCVVASRRPILFAAHNEPVVHNIALYPPPLQIIAI